MPPLACLAGNFWEIACPDCEGNRLQTKQTFLSQVLRFLSPSKGHFLQSQQSLNPVW